MKNFVLTLVIYVIFTAHIGKSLLIQKEGWIDSRISLTYCGMISKDIFSIKDCPYRESTNVYYPKWIKKIYYSGKTLHIIEVNELFLKFELKEEK